MIKMKLEDSDLIKLVMNKCKICGTSFEPNKYYKRQKYCSKECYRFMHRKLSRENIKRKRRLYKRLNIDVGNSVRHGTNSLASIKEIEVNGQRRIEGAVILEKMVKRKSL